MIQIGNAPCSWGTLEFESTSQSPVPVIQMLDELTSAGYVGSELGDWGYMPTEPHPLAALFRARGLSITGAYVGVRLADVSAHVEGLERALRTAQLLSETASLIGQLVSPFLVLADDNGADPVRAQHAGRITAEMELSESQWRLFAQGINEIARAVKQQSGLRTVFHPHCAGFVETHREIEQVMALTDAERVGLVFDTGHYSFGAGGSATLLAALEQFRERIRYIHFKDCDPSVVTATRENQWDYLTAVRHGIFCELGQGSVDFVAVKAWLEAQQYAGFVTVEQDILPGMGSPYASALRNRDYLRSIGL